jgi:hypothetical protein
MNQNNAKSESNQQYLLAIICISVCIAVAFLYLYLFDTKFIQDHPFGNFLGGVLPNFFASAIGVAIVYFLFTRKGIDPYSTIRDAIFEDRQMNQKLKQEIELTKTQMSLNKEIYSVLDKQNNDFKRLALHILDSNPLAKGLSKRILESFLHKFEAFSNGINIKDEYMSLYSYITFWEYLSELQEKKKKDKDDCIVVRVVHSNSIHIWTNEHDKYKELSIEIYRWQRKFIANGGIIVRILIGKDEFPNESYQRAMKEMEKCGIDAKYLHKSQKVRLQYDFLLLFDEKFTVKWKSDAHGDGLSECEYFDSISKDDARTWQYLFYELRDKGNPITSIPQNREFFINE